MRYVLVGATATMALLGAATLGHAQAPDDKGKGPAAEGKAPAAAIPWQGATGAGRVQAATARWRRGRKGAAQGRSQQPTTAPKEQPKAAQQQPATSPKSTDGQQKATQERTTDRPKGAEGPRGDTDKKQKSTEQQHRRPLERHEQAYREPRPGQGQGSSEGERAEAW